MQDFIDSRGRGTISQPGNRFEKHSVELDPAAFEEIAVVDPDFEPHRPETRCYNDDSKSIITKNNSPDLGFTYSLNPYRGCEHNIVPTSVDASGNPIHPPLSLFAPEKRFGMRDKAMEIDFEGQLNYVQKDDSAPVRPLDLRSGTDEEVIAENIQADLHAITDLSQIPPINQMNWLVVIEEVR